MNKSITKQNPEYTLSLHKRLGTWIIEFIPNGNKHGIVLYEESNYTRLLGVFYLLLDYPALIGILSRSNPLDNG
jgi:hypothetical protein